MNIIVAKNPLLLSQVDDFLYEQLWKPLNLSNDVRNNFKLDGKEITSDWLDHEFFSPHNIRFKTMILIRQNLN